MDSWESMKKSMGKPGSTHESRYPENALARHRLIRVDKFSYWNNIGNVNQMKVNKGQTQISFFLPSYLLEF